MAIRIPILTSFDPKGLKQANASFATLQSSVSSLGRNFATAGIAIGAIGVGLAKTVQTASSYAESVNAVNVAFGKSAQGIIDFGKTAATTLGVSQVDFNNAAVRFSAFAERIVGSGGDASKFIAEISTRASDFASVFNIEVSEALQVFQSGLAGEAEPLKRFGINLLDSEVKAYAMANGIGAVGKELTETEKVQARYGLLMQATSKTQGDFANTSDGLANQLRILKAEVSNTQIEIGNQLLPVMAELLPIVRDLVKDLGTQLVAAVKAVDWKALTTDLMNTARFFIENATAIAQVTVAIFAINTAYKLMQVAIGITNVALALNKWWLAQTATGMTIATVATNIFSTALKLIPFVAVVAGIGLIIAGISEADSSYRTTTPVVTSFGEEVLKTGYDAEWAAGRYGVATTAVKNFNSAISSMPTVPRIDIPIVGGGRGLNLPAGLGGSAAAAAAASIISMPTASSGGGSSSQSVSDVLKREGVLATRETKLLSTGISAGFADLILNTATTKKTFQKELASLTKSSAAATKAQAKFNKTSAGRAEIANNAAKAAAEASAAASQAAAEMAAAQEAAARAAQEAADREAAIIAERERVFKSFADSVKNTFAGIKTSILGAFDLTELGGSSNAITRNMDKLLVRLRAFAANVKNLATMGLDPALLQQVISAGPMGGARLAEALVMGGASGLSALNAGYSEFGNLSSQIAQTGTESLFNQGNQQSIYNISVDGGVGSGSTIGKAIVDAIKAYERTSGAVWQGA
jgi:hypothetical protein